MSKSRWLQFLELTSPAEVPSQLTTEFNDDVGYQSNAVVTPDDEQFFRTQELFEEALYSEGLICEDEERLSVDQVEHFCDDVLQRCGWWGPVDTRPVIAFDIPDDAPWAGVHSGAGGVIHLHPRFLDKTTLLHELAHWLVGNGEGHGPRFAYAYSKLVAIVYDREVQEVLLSHYTDLGVACHF